MQNLLNSENLLIAQKSLDALWLKQKVISNNIANIDTPGFKSSDVVFEDILKNMIDTCSSGQEFKEKLAVIEPRIVKDNSTKIREDGNNVDIDAENIELTRVQLQYDCISRIISEELSRLQYVVKGGA